MNRTDRLTGILLALRGGQQTAAQLAERFAVSRRTILRDLAALGELGIPVIAVPGAGGGVALPAGYWLPPLRLSAAEATAVLLGLAALGPAAGSPFGEPRRTAEEKIRAVIDADTLRASEAALRHIGFDPGPAPPEAAHIQAIQHAIATEQWLRMAYRSARRVADHEILPVRLVASEGRWYVEAISREARARRRYRLDRIGELRRIPTPLDADAIREAAALAVAYDHADHPEVILRLTDAGVVRAPDLLGVRLAPEPRDDGLWEVRFRCPASELPFYARCVLVLGDDCRAVGPPALIRIVLDMARATLERYADDRA